MPDLKFSGLAVPLTDAGVTAAAVSIGTTARLLRTIMAVETAGRGFDKGRLRMLFEPGVFYKRVPARLQPAAVKAGVALASMTGHRYPNDSYPLLTAAVSLDRTSALESASWGLPQIMGFNHAMVGYASAEAMVAAMVDSEDVQVMALARFLAAAGLVGALNAQRWAAVAKGYNGSGYEQNNYDGKLAAAYASLRDATAVAMTTAVLPRAPQPTPVLDSIVAAVNAAAAPPVPVIPPVSVGPHLLPPTKDTRPWWKRLLDLA